MLYFVNHSGHAIEIVRSAISWRSGDETSTRAWGRWRPLSIANGVGRQISNDALGDTWIIDARVSGCRVRYEAPIRGAYSDRWTPFGRVSRYHVATQLEPDGRLFLVPVRFSGQPAPVDVTPFVPMQPPGFPVEPSSRLCNRR